MIYCYYCDKTLLSEKTIDHIIPISRYGNNDEINKVLCCVHCNQMKGNLTLEEFIDRIAKSPLSKKRRKLMISRVKMLIQFRNANLNKMINTTLIELWIRKIRRRKISMKS